MISRSVCVRQAPPQPPPASHGGTTVDVWTPHVWTERDPTMTIGRSCRVNTIPSTTTTTSTVGHTTGVKAVSIAAADDEVRSRLPSMLLNGNRTLPSTAGVDVAVGDGGGGGGEGPEEDDFPARCVSVGRRRSGSKTTSHYHRPPPPPCIPPRPTSSASLLRPPPPPLVAVTKLATAGSGGAGGGGAAGGGGGGSGGGEGGSATSALMSDQKNHTSCCQRC